jgi:hypothetical protein
MFGSDESRQRTGIAQAGQIGVLTFRAVGLLALIFLMLGMHERNGAYGAHATATIVANLSDRQKQPTASPW